MVYEKTNSLNNLSAIVKILLVRFKPRRVKRKREVRRIKSNGLNSQGFGWIPNRQASDIGAAKIPLVRLAN